MKTGIVVSSGVFRRGAHVWGAALLAAAVFAAPAAGQGTAVDTVAAVSRPVRHTGPSPLVAADHWAVRAARRAEGLGWVPGYLPAQGSVPRAALADALDRAALAAPQGRARRMAEGWRARFRDEFGEYREGPPAAGTVARLGGRAAVQYAGEWGRHTPAIHYAPRQDPRELPGGAAPRVRADAGAALGGHAALWADARLDEGGAALARWEALAGAGPFSLSLGRQGVGYGPGVGGGVVLFENQALLRVEAQTTAPVRLPSLLRLAGPVSLHVFASRMDDPGRHPDPAWLGGARLALQPHPRLTLAVNRASIFGTEAEPVTAARVARMLAGVIRSSNFENQIVSLEGRYRLPTDAVLPVTVYLEWGADDGAGALDEEPATVAGLFLPSLPGLPEVAAGAELTRFAPQCCGHGVWYFNSSQRGNWARGSRVLGHPLGGEGNEAMAYAQAELLDGRLRLAGRAFTRNRSIQSIPVYGGGNLFAPAHAGRSVGGAIDAALRLGRVELGASGFRDAGDGWREDSFQLGAAAFF
jgi:hypothetical protein